MPFLQELQCGSGYYEPKNFVSTLPVNQTCAFQQVQHPVPYQPNGAFHFDHYSIQSFNLPLPQPSFYYTTTAGPSLHPVHQNTLPLEDTLRAESEDGPHQASGKVRTANKRGRPTKNPVWTHFHRLNDKHVQCNMCGKLVKSACATNMRKHMERHHGDDISGTPDGVLEANFYGYSKSSQLEDTVSDTNGQLPQTMWKCNNQKRKRRTKHPVWDLFNRDIDGSAQCKLCSAVVRSPCSSNFMGHLNRHHSKSHEAVYQRWLEGRVADSNSEIPRTEP